MTPVLVSRGSAKGPRRNCPPRALSRNIIEQSNARAPGESARVKRPPLEPINPQPCTDIIKMGKLSKAALREELARHASENVSILEKSDEKEVAHVFGDAFTEDEMIAWIAGLDEDDPKREEKMHALAKYLMR